MTIGEGIKRRRKELGLSADQLAAAIGKDRSTIYRYEKGDIESAPVEVIVSLAQVLKMPPPYLLGWDKRPEYWLHPKFYDKLLAKFEELCQTTDVFDWSHEEATLFLELAKFIVNTRGSAEHDGDIAFLRTLFRRMNR